MRASAIGGTFLPSAPDAVNKFWQKLVDGQISAQGSPTYWAETDVSTTPSMTLELDQAYTDIIGVTVYPRDDTLAAMQSSYNLSVYLSPTSAFTTDPNKVICGVEGLAYLLERSPVFFPCPGAADVSVSYLTLFRVAAAASSLQLQEVQIQRSAGEAPPIIDITAHGTAQPSEAVERALRSVR